MINAKPDDTIAWVTVRLHAHGEMSISGTIGERKLALDMLAHAVDAIRRQIPKEGELYVPNSDVQVSPNPGFVEMGDLPAHQRGDP